MKHLMLCVCVCVSKFIINYQSTYIYMYIYFVTVLHVCFPGINHGTRGMHGDKVKRCRCERYLICTFGLIVCKDKSDLYTNIIYSFFWVKNIILL